MAGTKTHEVRGKQFCVDCGAEAKLYTGLLRTEWYCERCEDDEFDAPVQVRTVDPFSNDFDIEETTEQLWPPVDPFH